ncbi:MAG: MIP/aquaporin family protein [Peptoniphilaceae bacterium]|nr:aquaporin family protein [Peptoniphilaceae bacterium]MDD7383123.1 aquaporin family protein [Peptoniphilaceae bacterium]MDY3738369.1 MIP/aquaporin family protein [Peptoniphilaceae bacterium]
MRDIFVGELVGTFLLILFGSSICANVNMSKSGMHGAGPIVITIGWGFAVMVPAFCFGAMSGASFNPALTIALALKGDVMWNTVPIYIIAQLLGAILGASLTWALFKDHFDAKGESPEAIRGCFCTAPTIPNTLRNLLSEIVGTFVLCFTIFAMSAVPQASESGVDKLFTYSIIVLIGMSFGGLTGYAINPARDLGPRIAYTILPFKNKTDSNWAYAWIPVVGPIIGAIIAVGLYSIVF